jgi:hypothetical protein
VPSLTTSAERHLYDTDRTAWLRHAAPRMAAVLADTGDDAALGDSWARLPRDYQRAVWRELDDPTQDRIRAARAAAELEHAA